MSKIALCVFFCIVLTFESFWPDDCMTTIRSIPNKTKIIYTSISIGEAAGVSFP